MTCYVIMLKVTNAHAKVIKRRMLHLFFCELAKCRLSTFSILHFRQRRSNMPSEEHEVDGTQMLTNLIGVAI